MSKSRFDVFAMTHKRPTEAGDYIMELQRQLAELKPEYTTEPPTEPGWYWIRDTRGNVGIDNYTPLFNFDKMKDWVGFEWAGPIQEPEDG